MSRFVSRRAALAATAAAVVIAGLHAQALTVASVFGDHMVLQRGRPIPVWGFGRPDDSIVVTLGDQRVEGVVQPTGRWRVELPAQPAGGPFELKVHSSQEWTFRDVLIGEVWICSGQSNMAWPVVRSDDAEAEIAAAKYPRMRLLHVKRNSSEHPIRRLQATWKECSPETVERFSAVGYYFGRELHRELDVPIGLIASACGGTPAEAWIRPPALAADADFRPILTRWSEWPNKGHRPSGLFHGMVAPLTRFSMRGVIWYQGEANANRAYQYRKLFPALITDWRAAWGQGDFPFLFVQLASYHVRVPETWAELREAQLMALELPNTGMAVTIDVGNPKDIHPRNKQDVGKRLALWALAETYGRDLVYSGPLVSSVERELGGLRVRFRHTGGGLVARGGGELRGFEVATASGLFAPARALIDGETVVVTSDRVPDPVHVRYAWTDTPDGNLMNAEGLPASPFRNDDRPGFTEDAK